MPHDFELLWPDESVPTLCVVESLVLRPVGNVIVTSTPETLSPLALTVAVSVADSPTDIGSSELSERLIDPAAKDVELARNNARIRRHTLKKFMKSVSLLKRISSPLLWLFPLSA